jgi:allophanate hydrolase
MVGEMAVALVGAHMTGLPLNPQIAGLGGRFLQRTTTAPRYRLFRLAGPPPARPGMIRDDSGAAIEVEVWAMPLPQIGAFLSLIPSPLGLGKIELADGTMIVGFLAESAGVVGAEEITAYGGWRAYLSVPKAHES